MPIRPLTLLYLFGFIVIGSGLPQLPTYSGSYSSVNVQRPSGVQQQQQDHGLQFQSYLIDPKAIDKEKSLIPADEEVFDDGSSTTTELMESTTELMESTTNTMTTTTINEENELSYEGRKNSTGKLVQGVEEGSGHEASTTEMINSEEDREIKNALRFESGKVNSHENMVLKESPDYKAMITTTDANVEVIYPENIDVNMKCIPDTMMETTTIGGTTESSTDPAATTTRRPCKTMKNKPDVDGAKETDVTDKPDSVYPERGDNDNEVSKEIEPNYELAEEFGVEPVDNGVNVASNANNNPPLVDLFYYVYSPSGYLQRLATFASKNNGELPAADDGHRPESSSRLRFDTHEPIRELTYTYKPNLLILQRLRKDV